MAEIGQLSYSIILDDKEFNKQSLEIQRKLKNVDAAITGLSQGDSMKLAKPFDTAGLSIDKMIAQAKTLEATFKSLSQNGLNEMSQDAQNLRLRWQEIQSQLQVYGYRIKSSVMEQQTLIGAMQMQENTVGQIELKMRALSAVRKNINVTEKESLNTLKQVNDHYMRLGDTLKKVGARQYNLADMARNTNGAFSPLGFSIQQVARELPSLTMGAHMFFLAISNNIPILSDELRKAKASYAALTAEGKAAIPVWKQVVSSILSWQTAMVVGITLLTMYGREIGNWIKGVFGTKAANEELNRTLTETAKNIGRERAELDYMFKSLNEAKKGTDEYSKAKKNIIEQFGKYYNSLELEKLLVDDSAEAYKVLADSIYEAAKAKALAESRGNAGATLEQKTEENLKDIRATLISKLGEKDGRTLFTTLRKELEETGKVSDNTLSKLDQFGQDLKSSYGGKDYTLNINAVRQSVEIAIDNIKKAQDDYNLSLIESNDLLGDLFSKSKTGLSEQISLIADAEQALRTAQLLPSSTEDEVSYRNRRIKAAQDKLNRLNKLGVPDDLSKTPSIYNQQDKFNREQIRAAEDLQTEIAQAEIDGQQEGFEKRMAQMKLNHEVEIREIERRREDLLDKEKENRRKLFEAVPNNKGKKFDSSGITLSKEDNDRYDKLIAERKRTHEKAINDETKAVLEKYKDLYQKQKEIDKKYSTDLAVLEGLEQTDDVKASIAVLKKQWTDELIALSEDVTKLLNEEVPIGAGLAFRVSKVLSDTRNDIREKNKAILDAMTNATDDQKVQLGKLAEVWESAYREEEGQKLDSIAQSYFNELMKSQKLDIDMGSISSATTQQLNRLRDALKEIRDELGGRGLIDLFDSAGLNIDDFKEYIDTSSLSATRESLINLTTYTPEDIQLTEDQKKALEAIARVIGVIDSNQKKGILDVDLAKFEKAKGIANEIFSSFSNIGSALEDLADATGNEEMRSIAQDIQFAAAMAQNIGDVVSGIMSGDPKDIIKGITNTITTLIKAEAAYQKARLEFLNKQRELQIEFNKLIIEQIALQKTAADGVLYDNQLNTFRKTWESAQQAIKKGNELLGGGSVADYLGGIDVKTGVKKKKFLGITTGHKNVYGDLLKQFPQLIDSAGKLNVEEAKLILAQNEFAGDGKIALQELIEYTEAYEEAMKSLDEQIGSMFGEIGSLISNSLVDAFHDGKLSADEFLDFVNKGIAEMIDNLVTNMIVSTVFGEMLDNYKDKIKDALLSDDPTKSLTNLMGRLVTDIGKGTEAVGGMMSLYASEKEKAGLGSAGSSSRQGLSGSLARASQESIDELTGVMYAGLEKLSLTANSTNAININVTAMSAELKTQTALLRSIDGYSSNLPYMRTGIETMVNRGVRIQP